MKRYALRDDQWERIKDLLPGREGMLGGWLKIIDCLLKLCSTDIEQVYPGELPERFGD